MVLGDVGEGEDLVYFFDGSLGPRAKNGGFLESTLIESGFPGSKWPILAD